MPRSGGTLDVEGKGLRKVRGLLMALDMARSRQYTDHPGQGPKAQASRHLEQPAVKGFWVGP